MIAQVQKLEDMAVPQLRDLARELGLKGFAKLRRGDLVARLAPLVASTPVAPPPVPAALDDVLAEAPTSAGGPTSAPEAPAPAESEDSYCFPYSYGIDRAVLLVRDPRWLFAYWDVSGPTWESIEHRGLNDPGTGWRRLLRLHDVTDWEGEPSEDTLLLDIALSDGARDWYFHSPQPGRDYAAEYGYLSASGEFVRVALSNSVYVPRCAPSEVTDETWGHLFLHEEAYRLSLAGAQPAAAALTSAEVTRRLEELLAEGISSAHFAAAAPPGSRLS
jgi:hypothetical protein